MLKFYTLLFLAVIASSCAIERASEIHVAADSPMGLSTISVPNLDENIKLRKSQNKHAHFVAHKARMLMTTLPTISPDMRDALETQRALLKRQDPRKTYTVDGQTYTRHDFLQVIEDLLSGRYHEQSLNAVPVAKQAEVKFTGYYSPEIEVRKHQTATYKYPILEYPSDYKGKLPSRSVIESGQAFDVDQYAIAYAKHALDVYMLQLQGSGFVKFEEGEHRYLAYGGTNRFPYQSIERGVKRVDPSIKDISMRSIRKWVDQNPARDTVTRLHPNYGFFKLSNGQARGAAGVPLTPLVSVAADPKHYPLGSVLLASVPVAGKPGKFVTKILLVQDTGGAVKGDSHLDLYTGVGEEALDIAELTNTKGQVYLLTSR